MSKFHAFSFFQHGLCAQKRFFARHANPFDRFGGGRGGPDFRPSRLLTSEDLQLLILMLISEKPSHGYEIIKEIERRSSGMYTPSPGVIYPALTFLEEASFATSETEGAKKRYHISAAGSEHLAAQRQRASETLDRLSRWGEKFAHFRERMAEEDEADERWAGSPREQHRREWRQMKAEFHDLRHELKAALFEKFSASMDEKRRILEILRKAIEEIRHGKE